MENNKQPLSDEQFDEMLRMAVAEVFEEEMKSLPPDEEIERLYPYSERHEKRMADLLGQKRKRDYSFLRKPLKIAAAFSMIITLSFGVLLFNEGVRAAVANALIGWYDQFARFTFQSDVELDDASRLATWRPTYIPDGFYESLTLVFGAVTRLEYTNDDGLLITFRKAPADGSTIDVSRYYVYYFTKEHGGITYHVFAPLSHYGAGIIIWEQGGFSFRIFGAIYGYLEISELMAMALSVEPME